MFETVGSTRRKKSVAMTTLPISIVAHGLVIFSIGGAALLNIEFPTRSPRLVASYAIATVDVPPPPPPPAKLASPAPADNAVAMVAPTVIPDTIPIVSSVRAPTLLTPGVQQTAGAGGSLGGSADGVAGGVAAGGVSGGIATADDERVHIGRDKALPLAVIDKEDPVYPESELGRRLEATVILRYVIGTDGVIKDVEFLQHAKQTAFDEAILNAIRHWRFVPMQKNGKTVEVVHELTVVFRLQRR